MKEQRNHKLRDASPVRQRRAFFAIAIPPLILLTALLLLPHTFPSLRPPTLVSRSLPPLLTTPSSAEPPSYSITTANTTSASSASPLASATSVSASSPSSLRSDPPPPSIDTTASYQAAPSPPTVHVVAADRLEEPITKQSSDENTPEKEQEEEDDDDVRAETTRLLDAHERRQQLAAATVKGKRTPPQLVLLRAIGNDLPPRHGLNQTLRNVAFLLEQEPRERPRLQRRWYLNRMLHAREERTIARMLIASDEIVHRDAFNRTAFAALDFDLDLLLWHAPQTRLLAAPNLTEGETNKIAKPLVLSLVHNNGARNAMLRIGKELSGARFVAPWDGNCLFPDDAWSTLSATLEKDDPEVVKVPMARLASAEQAAALSKGTIPAPEAKEEEQMVFRVDSTLSFDPELPYGQKPKLSLLEALPDAPSVAWVGRLPSGRADLEMPGKSAMRGFARAAGLRALFGRALAVKARYARGVSAQRDSLLYSQKTLSRRLGSSGSRVPRRPSEWWMAGTLRALHTRADNAHVAATAKPMGGATRLTPDTVVELALAAQDATGARRSRLLGAASNVLFRWLEAADTGPANTSTTAATGLASSATDEIQSLRACAVLDAVRWMRRNGAWTGTDRHDGPLDRRYWALKRWTNALRTRRRDDGSSNVVDVASAACADAFDGAVGEASWGVGVARAALARAAKSAIATGADGDSAGILAAWVALAEVGRAIGVDVWEYVGPKDDTPALKHVFARVFSNVNGAKTTGKTKEDCNIVARKRLIARAGAVYGVPEWIAVMGKWDWQLLDDGRCADGFLPPFWRLGL